MGEQIPPIPEGGLPQRLNESTTETPNVLPYPEPEFNGKIRPTTETSESDFPQPYEAPAGSPNILLIMTDDVGFGASSTFGGPIPTPTFDKLAERGLKYNRFHTTSLCSPTRAALITGRNPHNANTGIIMERSLGYPGFNTVMSKSCGTVAEILRQNGYNTSWFGKNHNVPAWQSSAVGPFDLWPTGLGFEYFYGFIGGDCNQWAPAIYEGTTPIEPHLDKPDYHLDADLADQAIHWLQQQNSLDPDKPFFLYYVPGATHAPHHVPQEWIDKFKGQFNHGWDEQRSRTWQKQKDMGIIPSDAELTPRPDNLPSWELCSDREKELYCRMMEVYVAYLAYTDYNIGRVIDAVEQTGQLDNTLIIYIMGDNGGSAEGTLQGTANELAVLGNGETETLDYLCSIQDQLGGPMHYNHFPVPWSWAMNSPMQWTKRYASHFGGMRNGMVMSWPTRITDMGSIRSQFHHVIDIAPTIFEAAGIKYPVMELNGVAQKPLDGVPMNYTWDSPTVEGNRKTQYFEMYGNRSIYHIDADGSWLACTTPLVFAWEPEPVGIKIEDFDWELYNLDNDFTQAKNLATDPAYGDKLTALQALWWEEAQKNQVLPLNFSPQATIDAAPERPSITKGRTRFEYCNGITRIPEGAAPVIRNTSYEITAHIVVPEGGVEGTIITQGGRFAGWGLVVLDNKPVWAYKRTQQQEDSLRISGEALAPGSHTIVVKFEYNYPIEPNDTPKTGRRGKFTLEVDNNVVAHRVVEKTVPNQFSVDETLDVGEDTGTPILEDYADKMPFKFTGQITKVIIDLDSNPLSDLVKQAIAEGERKAALATD